MIAPDAGNRARIEELVEQAAAVRDARLAQLSRKEEEAARRRTAAVRRIVEGLRAERDELAMTDRERFVLQAVRPLSAEATEATEEHRRQVRELASIGFRDNPQYHGRRQTKRTLIAPANGLFLLRHCPHRSRLFLPRLETSPNRALLQLKEPDAAHPRIHPADK